MAAGVEFDRFRKACFVIMPFGTKEVGGVEVDFDAIYDEIFEPAIARVVLPEKEGGGRLRPIRADRAFYAGAIDQEMYESIEYSRFVLADISGLNPNVFYELGARHRAHASGTAVFRQEDAPIPFDIQQVRAFPYRYRPAEERQAARGLVSQVLSESLVRNALDSPVMLALRRQAEQPESVQQLLRDAENAVRDNDAGRCIELYERAARLDPDSPFPPLKASHFYKLAGRWDEAVEHLQQAVATGSRLRRNADGESVDYAAALRELGIAEHKRDRDVSPRAGENHLQRALQADPEDYDAWASLGGLLRRAGDLPGSVRAYESALQVSRGHPYPLLNVIKLGARLTGRLEIGTEVRQQLASAAGFRGAQVEQQPPLDVPWSWFDLAEIQLYLGEPQRARDTLQCGLDACTAAWMPETFADALELIPSDGAPDGTRELRDQARRRQEELEGGE